MIEFDYLLWLKKKRKKLRYFASEREKKGGGGGGTMIQFFRHNSLDFPIKFNNAIVLTNEPHD